MPYIKKEDRDKYRNLELQITDILENNGWNPGHFNYIVFYIINEWFKTKASYSTANTIVGALECIKQEFYRRQVAPYEDEKIKENGPV